MPHDDEVRLVRVKQPPGHPPVRRGFNVLGTYGRRAVTFRNVSRLKSVGRP